ncbi:MAG: winged helix-turn-helix domain-containing protein [Candidatus Woesearchaeota archaeon]|jgi:predicted transcriptional regulator|nr:winged helix-turn-helix domain-containing protein [Candidatus Woesearchaeota archaeon]MDP7622692.1 winged helix-turn-helix domain-containing protein [Candidatus Woesearchaeota archaeon]HJN57217.1 winged helix-turn-helix domain-containing protein [Candidatus Woesearchaeota archaeon]|tara:strand:- start:109 stop:384 length:276 start_codon:yes stop_codon:yes gene_type:complete
MSEKRRGKLEIIADILRSIQSKNGRIKPTHLLYKSNLSHAKLKEYIDVLMKKGMIEEKQEKGKKMFLMKELGYKFLLEFERIKEFSDSFGL